MNRLTAEQVAQLAPDAASLKAGRDLGNERKWLEINYNERVLWGEIQGSGKTPYRSQVDLQAIAFKCSCPSHKFPCKHGLGLLFLFAGDSDKCKEGNHEPEWVSTWINKRRESGTSESAGAKTGDTQNDKRDKDKAKREAERLSSVQAGAAELELILRDLLRSGLHTIPEKGAAFFEKNMRRMVDAKAPGLGNMLRNFNKINYLENNNWRSDVLENAAKAWLLLEGFRRIEQLPVSVQEDLRSMIGWNKKKEDLLQDTNAKSEKGDWLVLAKMTETEEDLIISRHWLYHTETHTCALILDFAHKNAPVIAPFIPGTLVQAELVFYPSNYPFRALVKTQGASRPVLLPGLLPLENWKAAQRPLAQALARYPWADDLPQFVGNLQLTTDGKTWYLQDEETAALALNPLFEEDKIYHMLAVSGGKPLNLFVLRTGKTVFPLGIVSQQYKPL